jgi:RimJ/RimL family protein N-acetyltransferase
MTAAFETERLRLDPMTVADAGVMLAILNDPDFITHVADRGIRTLAEAEVYVAEGPAATWAAHGYGPFVVGDRADGTILGTCGLHKRPFFDHPDLGYGFLPAARGRGYAREAAAGVVGFARATGLKRLLATVSPANPASWRLLEGLGFAHERDMIYPGTEKTVRVYGLALG